MPHAIAIFLVSILSLPALGMQAIDNSPPGNLMTATDYNALILNLGSMRSEDPERWNATAGSYLLARIYEKSGDIALATAIYAENGARDDGLRLYANRHLSRMARISGDLALERLFLRELVFSPDSNLATLGASRRLAFNYYESTDYPAVIQLIERGYPSPAADWPESESDRELQSLLAGALLAIDDKSRARIAFDEIIATTPDRDEPDDFSLMAVEGLDRLENQTGKTESEFPVLSAQEHKQRGDIYQFNRAFDSARLHYSAIVEAHKSDEYRPLAMFQIGRGYSQQRNDKAAAEWFERLRDEYPEHDLAEAALYGAAGSYANLDQTDKAVRYYLQYIDANPDGGDLERAYLNIVDAYRDAGNFKPALAWSRKAQVRFKGESGEAIALFSEAKAYIALEDWQAAYSAIDRLSVLRLPAVSGIAGGTTVSEVRFLRGMVLEELNRNAESRSAFRSVLNDWRNYYGWRAGDRLRAAPEAKSRSNGPTPPGSDPGYSTPLSEKHPGLRAGPKKDVRIPEMRRVRLEVGKGVASLLLGLGLFDEAAPEMEVALRKARNIPGTELTEFDQNTAYTLAELYANGGYADRAVRFIEPQWRRVPRGFDGAHIPRDQAVLLYPVPFRDSLLRYCSANGVDPRFLLSIMRQESRFQSDIKSAAAARGLMQFVSGTSAKIASELGISDFDQNDLYDPDTAIRFGAKYISNISKDFPEQLPAIAASYNGGEDRMARWMKRANSTDPDRFVAEIVFGQTKDYTYKVMSNYRMYTLLYDENLLPRTEKKNGNSK